jgi:low temperature requirement protein LtrA
MGTVSIIMNIVIGKQKELKESTWYSFGSLLYGSKCKVAYFTRKDSDEDRYFHKGLLWRASGATEVASYELFIDLMYVAILAITGDAASEEATGNSLLRFAITYIMAWKIWSDVGIVIAWISMDDIIRRLSVLLILVLLLGLTVNMAASQETTYTPLVSFYVATRFYWTLYYVWMSYLIPMVRGSMLGNAIMTLVPAILWIGSIHVQEPQRQALVWIALFFDFFGPVILVAIQRGGNWMGKLQPWAKKTFEFMPGNNIEHKIERTNAFVSLVFGYSVVALFYQSSVPFGINGFFGKAVLGLIQSFIFNWIYFEVDTFNMMTHAIRHSYFSGKNYP